MTDPRNHMSRRHFLKTAVWGSAAVTAGLTGVSTQRANGSEGVTVPKRAFGKTGVDVSILSLGGMFDIGANQLLLRQALKSGVTYWDTANSYGGGNSEKGFGLFFSKFPDSRKEVFLVTKSGERDPSGLEHDLNLSLKRMNTAYIDLFFVHAVRDISEMNDSVRNWALAAKKEGKIRFIGFSTHSNMEDCLLRAASLGWIDGIMTTYNFRLLHSAKMKEAVSACVEAGIGLTAMKTQGGGSVKTDTDTELKLAGRFLEKGYTDKQAKLKAVWENPDISSICSQMPNMTILMSNIMAAVDKNRLSSGELDLLDVYARETLSDYCAGCSRICETAVTESVPICDIMRFLMYFRNYENPQAAARLFQEIPENIRIKIAEVDYRLAENRCPRKLAIGKFMHEAMTCLG
jgi:hypothetical protein